MTTIPLHAHARTRNLIQSNTLMSEYDDELREIETARQNLSKSVSAYEANASDVLPGLYRDIRPILDKAITGLTRLGGLIVRILKESGQARRDHISAVKHISFEIAHDFQAVVTRGECTMGKLGVFRSDVVHKRSLAERTVARADELIQKVGVSEKNSARLVSEEEADIARDGLELANTEVLEKKLAENLPKTAAVTAVRGVVT